MLPERIQNESWQYADPAGMMCFTLFILQALRNQLYSKKMGTRSQKQEDGEPGCYSDGSVQCQEAEVIAISMMILAQVYTEKGNPIEVYSQEKQSRDKGLEAVVKFVKLKIGIIG